MPNFEGMSFDELKVEVSKYGVKATSKRDMVAKLKEIWEVLHSETGNMFVEDSSYHCSD